VLGRVAKITEFNKLVEEGAIVRKPIADASGT
jgi:hypothetical protein